VVELLREFITELSAEIVVTILTGVVMASWIRLKQEPFELRTGAVSRYELLHWSFTLVGLFGAALLGWAILGNDGQNTWRVVGNWLLYLGLSTGVLWISYTFLLHQKTQVRLLEARQKLAGRNNIAQATLAKAAAILLWCGVLAVFGPSQALLIWSLVLGVTVDGYVLWRILQVD
jgi:hypothetical protein